MQLVIAPAESAYVWYHVLQDSHWRRQFQTWLRDQLRSNRTVSLSMCVSDSTTEQRSHATKAPDPFVAERNVGGLLLHYFGCRSVHEAMLLFRMYAEKFYHKEVFASPTAVSMENYCARINSRREYIMKLLASTQDESSGVVTDLTEYLWVVFNMRIRGGPTNFRKHLTHDKRNALKAAHFDQNDAVVLLSCLTHLFLPSLTYEQCLSLSLNDIDGDDASPTEADNDDVVHSAQSCFVDLLARFCVLWVDTMTVNEFVALMTACLPAVLDAQTRIAQGGKIDVTNMRRQKATVTTVTVTQLGDGFHIRHLDVLGRRLRQTRYA